MNLSNQDVQLAQGMFVSSTTQQHPLGTRGYTMDGRAYRYAKAGTVALVAGTVIQSPALVVGNQIRAINTTSAVSAGSSVVRLTCGSSAAANLYAEGYLAIGTGAGQGYVYQVNNHAAVSTGATGSFNLYSPEDNIVVAITTTSKASLLANKYSGVVIQPASTATGVCVGVATYVIGASEFGWLQTWGPVVIVLEGTPALGSAINGISGTAGRAAVFTAASLLTGQYIGQAAMIGVAEEFDWVDLRIAP